MAARAAVSGSCSLTSHMMLSMRSEPAMLVLAYAELAVNLSRAQTRPRVTFRRTIDPAELGLRMMASKSCNGIQLTGHASSMPGYCC